MISLAGKPTLEGERITLRPVVAADALHLHETSTETLRLTGTHHTHELPTLERWYATRADHDDRLDLRIVDRATGRDVGEVVLSDLDTDNESCSLRVGLERESDFGKGYGTEAVRLILAYAFDIVGVHRVELEVYAFNPRARHVYETIGFVYEGAKRDALLWAGERVDAVLMSILAPDWAAHRGRP